MQQPDSQARRCRGTVLVGMSGGVDSTMAAWLLRQGGYEVIGATLVTVRETPYGGDANPPCGAVAATAAAAAARHLGVRHHVLDVVDRFEARVVEPFVREYRQGRTPNPCVVCNPALKFDVLLRAAREHGAESVATGHYARVVPAGRRGAPAVARGRDRAKDQSYFLSRLTPDQLSGVRFPLGDRTKDEVRSTAREQGFPAVGLDESQEVCFAPDGRYADFLRRRIGAGLGSGEIVDESGSVLGRHDGVEMFTIGQRRGLRIGGGKPLYVLDIDVPSRRVVVGDDAGLYRSRLTVADVVWTVDPDDPPCRARVQLRRRHEAADARLQCDTAGARVDVEFERPQRAITPGQAAVFYCNDVVYGSGWIAAVS